MSVLSCPPQSRCSYVPLEESGFFSAYLNEPWLWDGNQTRLNLTLLSNEEKGTALGSAILDLNEVLKDTSSG